jgi:hypothetical protein
VELFMCGNDAATPIARVAALESWICWCPGFSRIHERQRGDGARTSENRSWSSSPFIKESQIATGLTMGGRLLQEPANACGWFGRIRGM